MGFKMLDLFSALLTTLGSIILAIRLYIIMKHVTLALNVHEDSINKLIRLSNDPDAISFGFTGATNPLDIFSKDKGLKLMVFGFACMGMGGVLKLIEIVLSFFQ
ncbi:hypothetical protein DD577_19285 [Klebsiella pneumoniae]|nr:hypothetical protein DD579_12130 [Klebsiella pneumoniae]RXY10657.1 hypothetical protein DD587_03995 [Klebsiella pneumoniae]RXY12103.1 hypothetical protein DD578_08390 [Klebsiella pneumoniae]RXY21794.1 hypothetical protein DD576_03620 [Klebsiella pneumoniae]RXY32985.1 hypothetical protein DD577_19285 [Klebsiella pneumoniae]